VTLSASAETAADAAVARATECVDWISALRFQRESRHALEIHAFAVEFDGASGFQSRHVEQVLMSRVKRSDS
jgi:hypothetical protein